VKLVVAAVGRMKAGPERDLAERYAGRAGELTGRLGLSGPHLVEVPESRARDAPTRRREEWAALAARTQGMARIALDERGRALTTEDFARAILARREAGAAALAFLIGGADGLDAAAHGMADAVLSFGAMTLPHQLVRILLLEQIYRALTLHLGHPYHRA
jgi:23S rRNA (pseudouridine1915-N3)-methyltransferase